MNKITIGFCLIAGLSFGQTEVYNEDFQSGLPVDYTIVDNDGLMPHSSVSEYTDAWIVTTDPDNANDTVLGSTSYFDPVGEADRWLITPDLSLGAFGNILHWEAKSHDASFPDDYYVLLSVTDSLLGSFIDTVGYVQEEYATWTSRSVSLSEYGYNNQDVHIAFVNRTDDGFKLYIDDIRLVTEDPVSVNEIPEIAVRLYPNPVKDELRINAEDVRSVLIHSVEGKEVYVGDSAIISTINWFSGVYLVTINTVQGSITKKILKR